MRKLFVGYDAKGRRLYIDFDPNTGSPHAYVIGSTRTGKSKLLEWMIRGHIKQGEGLTLIDYHGTLYEDITKWCAYHVLNKDIILLNPSNGDYVAGFNPFQKTQAEMSVQIDNQIADIIRAWGAENTDQTPSLEAGLRYVLETMSESNQTILAGQYLISFFRRQETEYLTSHLSKMVTVDYAKGLLEAKTIRQFLGDLQMFSTRSRLTRFLTHPQICRFMGMRDHNIDLDEIMDEGKILLVNLKPSDHLSEENAKVFGTLLIGEFLRHALRRKRDKFGNPPRDHYLYIDEFQNFVKTPDIADMLDQVAKFGLHLILAHQRLGQIEREVPDLIDAIFTNIKAKIIFGGLTRDTAEYVVRNCFVNQLDLKQIKKALYQVRFWPVYGRDTVYASTYGGSGGGSTLASTSSGLATHLAPAEGWFDGWIEPPVLSTTESGGGVSAEGDFWGESWSEAEIDIPIFYPVPYYGLASLEYWSRDEQIWRMSEALMAQPLRHCFIQLPGQSTQPMLVPFVKEFYVSPKFLLEYQGRLYKKAGALPARDVDMLIEQEKKKLEQEAQMYTLEEMFGDSVEPTTFKVPKKATKKGNPKPPEK